MKPMLCGDYSPDYIDNGDLEEYNKEFLPEEFAMDREKRQILMDVIKEETNEMEMMTIMMFYYNDESISNIANYMDCAEITVKKRLAAARKKIRDGIEKKYGKGVVLMATGFIFVLGKAMKAEASETSVPASLAGNIKNISGNVSIELNNSQITNGGIKMSDMIKNTNKLSGGAIAGICTGVAAVVAAVTIGVVAMFGGGDSDNKNSNINVSQSKEYESTKEISSDKVTEDTTNKEVEETSTKGATTEETTEVVKELVAYDIDLSAYGELVDKFYVISNDVNKLPSKSELYTYLSGKDYKYYEFSESDVDKNILTLDEAFSNYGGIYMKPDFLLENVSKPKYSAVSIVVDDDTEAVTGIQYKLTGCTQEYVDTQKALIEQIIASGAFDNENIEIKYYGGDDEKSWKRMTITFYGTPFNNPKMAYFAQISIGLGTYDSLLTFRIY